MPLAEGEHASEHRQAGRVEVGRQRDAAQVVDLGERVLVALLMIAWAIFAVVALIFVYYTTFLARR